MRAFPFLGLLRETLSKVDAMSSHDSAKEGLESIL